jgi:translation initiation factor 4B
MHIFLPYSGKHITTLTCLIILEISTYYRSRATPRILFIMSGKGKKMKGQTMGLNDFLQSSENTSWVDDDHEIPSGPVSSAGPLRGPPSGPASRGMDSARTPSKPFPNGPPYTAYVGNLGYDISEDDLGMFFMEVGKCEVKFPRIVIDKTTQQSKGFGYVEFLDLASLKNAINLDGYKIAGRPVRIDIAEPQQLSGNDRGSGNRSMNFRSDRQDRQEHPQSDRSTTANNWRRADPVEYAAPRGFATHSRSNMGGQAGHGRDEDRDFNRAGFNRPARTEAVEPLPSSTEGAPLQRKKLDLAPRTKPITKDEATSRVEPAPQSGKKSNPFGNAKPIDTTDVLKKAEEVLAAKIAQLPASSPGDKKSGSQSRNRPANRKDGGKSRSRSRSARSEARESKNPNKEDVEADATTSPADQ